MPKERKVEVTVTLRGGILEIGEPVPMNVRVIVQDFDATELVTSGAEGIELKTNEFEEKYEERVYEGPEQCNIHWRAGVLTPPGGGQPADGARCLEALNHEGNHKFPRNRR